jgi:hypothetical protein
MQRLSGWRGLGRVSPVFHLTSVEIAPDVGEVNHMVEHESVELPVGPRPLPVQADLQNFEHCGLSRVDINSFVRIDESFSKMSAFRAKQREVYTKAEATAAEFMDVGLAGMKAGNSLMARGITLPGQADAVLKNLGLDLDGSAIKVFKAAVGEFNRAMMMTNDPSEISEIAGHRNRVAATISQHYVAEHDMSKALQELMPLFDSEIGHRLTIAAIDRYTSICKSDEPREMKAKAARDVATLFLGSMGHEYSRTGVYNTVTRGDIEQLLDYSESLHPAAKDNVRLRNVLEGIGR